MQKRTKPVLWTPLFCIMNLIGLLCLVRALMVDDHLRLGFALSVCLVLICDCFLVYYYTNEILEWKIFDTLRISNEQANKPIDMDDWEIRWYTPFRLHSVLMEKDEPNKILKIHSDLAALDIPMIIFFITLCFDGPKDLDLFQLERDERDRIVTNALSHYLAVQTDDPLLVGLIGVINYLDLENANRCAIINPINDYRFA